MSDLREMTCALCRNYWSDQVVDGLPYHADCAHDLVVGLGLSIGRFVRRTEVERLRGEVIGAARAWKCVRGFELEDQQQRVCHWMDLMRALDKLSALATGGEG